MVMVFRRARQQPIDPPNLLTTTLAPAGASVPFHQHDWPAPARIAPARAEAAANLLPTLLANAGLKPVANCDWPAQRPGTWRQYQQPPNLLLETLARPFGQTEWRPSAAPRTSQQPHQPPDLLLTTLATAPAAKPFAQPDWQNPRPQSPGLFAPAGAGRVLPAGGAPPAGVAGGSGSVPARAAAQQPQAVPNLLTATLLTPAAAPFARPDWQQPRAGRSQQATQPANLLPTLLANAGLKPVADADWPNPAPAKAQQPEQRPSLLVGPLARPFGQTDWQQPPARPAARPGEAPPDLLLTTLATAPAAKPFAQPDWQNPRPQSPGQQPVTAANLLETALAGAGLKPFAQSDWRNPAWQQAQRNQPAVDLPLTTLAVATTAMPFGQSDWPRPAAKKAAQPDQPSDLLLTLLKNAGLKPPAAFDWPNPAPAKAQQPEQRPSLLVGPLARPFAESDWPNPTAPRRGQDGLGVRGHLLLAGKDKFFGAPGQGPRYDHPNPPAGKPTRQPEQQPVPVCLLLSAPAAAVVQRKTFCEVGRVGTRKPTRRQGGV